MTIEEIQQLIKNGESRTLEQSSFSIHGENSGENLLTERQQHIYNSMKENGENTAKDLARILGLSQRTVEREISFLRHNGYTDKDGTNKGVWIILK